MNCKAYWQNACQAKRAGIEGLLKAFTEVYGKAQRCMARKTAFFSSTT